MRAVCLLVALGFCLFTLGCSDTSLVLDVGNIPSIATELRAVVRLDAKQSVDIPRFAFSAGHSTYSIGLNLKGQMMGKAQVTLGAFQSGCLLSSAVLEIPDLATTEKSLGINLDPPMSDVTAGSCPDAMPVLMDATTARNPATGGNVLIVTGFGFTPVAQVILDHTTTAATGYVSADPREFQVDLPRLIPPVDHALHIVSLQPDGTSGMADFTVSIPVFDDTQPVMYPSSASDPFYLLGPAVADDLDGDGHIDLAVTANGPGVDSGVILVYFNKGGGQFLTPQTIHLGAVSREVAAVHLRAGSLHDLAVTTCHTPMKSPTTTYSNCNLVIIQQNKVRTFSQQLTSRDGGENNGQQSSLVAGDFNGDGLSDVAVITNSATTPFSPVRLTGLQSQLKLYDGKTLTVNSFNVGVIKTLSGPAVAIVTGSLQPVTSTLVDLAIAQDTSAGGGVIEVFQNPGNGRFDQVTPTQIPLSGRPGRLTTGDYDVDGHTDLAAAAYLDNKGGAGVSVNVFLRRNVTWSQQTIMTGVTPLGIATVDLLSDGSPDLVISNSRTGTQSAMIRLLFNLNQGMFGASAPTAEPLPSTSEASLLVADFNQDMRQDLVVSNYGIAGTAGAHAGALSILFGL